MLRKFFAILLSLVIALAPSIADARPRGITAVPDGSSFNGGKFQINPNFSGIGGDYPFINLVKNSSGSWSLRDNSGSPTPADVDQYGYPLNGSDAIVNHAGVSAVVRIPAQAYIGGNCFAGTSGTGTCFFNRLNGKGTSPVFGTIITSSPSTATVTTGSTTSIAFSLAQDFRAGMEVPISGTTGVTATNGGGGALTGGGTTGAWTVCAAGLTTTNIRLCLNDQVTPLTTTGTPAGTTVVTYGRAACGVPAGCRLVESVTGSPSQITPGISAQDATTPITYRNGIDGIVVGLQGSEETRYEAGQVFGATYLAKLRSINPGVIRALNVINTNSSMEVNWADRMPVGYFSYGSHLFDRGTTVYAGTTTSTLNNYSLTLGSGAPVDGQQISFSFDATAVTVTNGANALVTWTAHGLSNGTPIVFGSLIGGSAPGGVTVPSTGGNSISFTYFAITTCGSCDADHIQFATTTANALAGTAVTTSSTGSNVVAHASTTAVAATFTASSTSIAWPNHLLSINDRVSFAGSVAYPMNQAASYFVKSVPDSGHITISATAGGAAITAPGSGSYVLQATKDPTLSLNGTTAVPIHDDKGYGVGTVKSTQPVARLSTTKAYGVATYDGVLNIWVKNGGDSSYGTGFFVSGWPPEIFLRLANELGAHPWFSPTMFTVDGVAGITNYNTSLYAYVHANAAAWSVPRFEVTPNEYWNATNFAATTLGIGHAIVYVDSAGWSQNSGIHQIAGKIGSVLGQAVHNEYGGTIDGTRYQTVQGVQTFNFSAASGATANAPRLTAANYVAQSTSPQSPYTKSAASNWATHVACAQYFYPGYYNNFTTTALAAANAGGLITGSISGNQLTVTSVDVVTSPVFGAGSVLMQGPGVIPGTVVSGSSSPYTLDQTYSNPVASTRMSYVASGSDATAVQTFLDSSINTATFTGSISGSVLTATGVTGFITTGGGSGGDLIQGTGVPGFLNISSQASGTTGKDGNYNLTASGGTVTSRAMTSSGVFSLPAENLMYVAINAFAQTYTNTSGVVLKVNGYEGSYSPDYTGGGFSLNDQLYWRGKVTTSTANMATGIYGYVLLNAQNFKAAGGEFPSLFQFTGLSPSSNSWSATEDLYWTGATPIWNAYRDYNFLLNRDLNPASNDNTPMWLEKAA